MLFGINGGEFIVLLIVAAVVIGPERLPGYAEQLAAFVRSARKMLANAKSRVDSELGEELGDVDWSSLDPRRYDPRRIVRDALMEDEGLGLGAIIGSQGLRDGAGPGSQGLQGHRTSPGAQHSMGPGLAWAGGVAGTGTGKQTTQDVAGAGPAPFDDEAT